MEMQEDSKGSTFIKGTEEIFKFMDQKSIEMKKIFLQGLVAHATSYDHIKIIFHEFIKIEKYSGMKEYLVDKEENVQVRTFNNKKGTYIVILKSSDCIETIIEDLNKCRDSLNKGKELNLSCSFSKYDGNPLDTTEIIKVEIQNPIPMSNADTYAKLGKVIHVQNKKGKDIVIFSSVEEFLLIRKEYEIRKKKLRNSRNVYFQLNPNEMNKAAPIYCIITRNCKRPNNFEELIEAFTKKYPFKNQVETFKAPLETSKIPEHKVSRETKAQSKEGKGKAGFERRSERLKGTDSKDSELGKEKQNKKQK